MSDTFIYPDWPAPSSIQALSTTRVGGVGLPPYDALNLGQHVGDNPHTVTKNRQLLTEQAHLPEPPRWLNQVHSTQVINTTSWQESDKPEADAIFSHTRNHVCAMMTADCLPLLLCNQQGTQVAAIHAGWRGLAAGIIEKTVALFDDPIDILVWLGPAIGADKFEVGDDVFHAFTSHSAHASHAFQQHDESVYFADIYQLATQRLNQCGVTSIFGGDYCTMSDSEQFFSYRRDGVTGRMASLVWISDKE